MVKFRMNCPNHGHVIVIVDDADAFILRSEIWYAKFNEKSQMFNVYQMKLGVTEMLARRILDLSEDGLRVKFLNHNSLDHRRSNLTVETGAEHMNYTRQHKVGKLLGVCKKMVIEWPAITLSVMAAAQ